MGVGGLADVNQKLKVLLKEYCTINNNKKTGGYLNLKHSQVI